MRGVYFLANDGVYDLAVAFLNSFRKYNPLIPLCMIPYGDDRERLNKLQDKYNFSVFSDRKILKLCDDISLPFHGKVQGEYRKLACWEGEFDEFIYIDVDITMFGNIDFCFRLLKDYDFVANEVFVPMVWKDTIPLPKEQRDFGASTSFIASKKSALNIKQAVEKLPEALDLKEYFRLSCKEQPFLDYLMVTSGKKYICLLDLKTPVGYWAGTKGGKNKTYRVIFDRPSLYMHWGGKWQPNKLETFIRKLLGQMPRSFFMPYQNVWNHYRNL